MALPVKAMDSRQESMSHQRAKRWTSPNKAFSGTARAGSFDLFHLIKVFDRPAAR